MDVLSLASYAVVAFLVVMLIRAVVRTLGKEKQEREGAQQWAAENGWAYAGSDPQLIQQWPAFPIRSEGTATEVLTTRLDGMRVASFHYQRSRGLGGGTGQHMISIDTGRQMPTVVVVPPRRAVRLTRLVPVPQPDEGFSTSWTVLAADEAGAGEARTSLTGQFRNRMAEEAVEFTSLTIHDRGLLVCFAGRRDLTTLPAKATLLRTLAGDLMPR